MFGYIRPSKPHLSEQDEARFQSVYCGLCHELGRKYGFAARFVLNFDFTFLAILLSDAQEPECESCRCAAHPCKAQCVMAHTVALETAADHSLVLAWWQLRDHIEDHGFFKAIPYRLAALLLRGAYRKARTFVPEFDASVQRHLNDLHQREREHCASLDQAAEPFAALMADIADCVDDEMRRRVMKEIFYHLGRWIYLVDAADDFEKDAHSNCYNPLRYRYELDGDKLDEQSREAVAASQSHSYGYGSGNSYGNSAYGGAYGAGSLNQVRMAINRGDISLAERLLSGMSDHNAEWNFLMGVVCSRRGWMDEAKRYMETAVQMDPNNPEYQNALSALTGTGYRPNGFRSVHTANFDDSACLRCCAAWSCCTLFSGGGCYLLPCIYY